MTIKYLDSKRLSGLSSDAPTYETDFTTNTGWTATGTDVAVDSTTNDRLDFNIPNTASQTDAITYDLTSVSDSAWILRFKLVMDSYSQNTTAHAKKLLIGLSSAPHSTDVDSAQDAIGILFGSWDNGTHKIRSRDSDGGSWMGGSGTDFSEAFTDDEVYYVEIKRTSTTAYTVSLYSDSSYSTLIEAESETMASTIAGLRYLKVGIDTTTGTPSGTFTGYIDDVKFYNGVTTPSIKPTNVQDNSIYIETDTDKRYWFDGSSWINPDALPLATGGTIYTVGDYKIHKFTSTANFVVTSGGDFEVLVVGSGGGGGGLHGAGGGSGGAIYHATHAMTTGTYQAVIGAGGAKGVGRDVNGSNGNNCTFDGFTGFGGGYGASSYGGGSAKVGGNGGCGGGTAEVGTSTSTQTSHNGGTGYGQDGVAMDYSNGSLSGGSGLYAKGTNTTTWTGAPAFGGDGLGGTNNATFNDLLGDGQAGVEETTGNWYIGGGGGSMGNNATVPIGGKGGGGQGGTGSGGNSLACSIGVANTGSGGGGGYTTTWNGANGGSGVVLVRYKFQ